MQDVANAIRDVANSMRSSEGIVSSELSGTPQRRKHAIEMLSDDGDLSDDDSIRAFRLFRRNSSIADTYISIPQKRLCTAYIQEELSELYSPQH